MKTKVYLKKRKQVDDTAVFLECGKDVWFKFMADVPSEDSGQYLVMDYIEGEDIRQRMDRVGVLPEEEVVLVGASICDALQYLHTRQPPIYHRDIKPGNIKINPEGVVYLVDFGLAKVASGGQATTTGARAMTPGYSSPEQYGTARTDGRFEQR